MPLAFSPGIDYTKLRECQVQALASMPKKWTGGQWKWDEVLNRRAWKLYNRCV